MVIATNIVRALLSVCSQVAVREMVAGQTLVSRESGAFENPSERDVDVYPCEPRSGLNLSPR